MARRPRLFAPGLLYHVIARGNQRRSTFLDDQDYQAYLLRLSKYQTRYNIVLHAYCLMPNHVHLLLQTCDTPLAKFMQSLQQSYTQRFNRAHGTVGHLFQGRYQAIICDTDQYLATLVRYIHLNPVRAGLVDSPETYEYSGHCAYLDGRRTAVVDPGLVLRMLGGRDRYRRFVEAGSTGGHEARYYELEDQQFLGSPDFAQRTRQKHPTLGGQTGRPPLEVALAELTSVLALDVSSLRGPDRSHSVTGARALVSLVLVRRLGYPLTAVARALGRDTATLSIILSRTASRLETDCGLAATIERATSKMLRSKSLTPVVR